MPLIEAVRDRGLEVCRIRHFLRTGQIAKADTVAARVCQTPAARFAWPYRSLIWRLQNDPRARWLDGDPAYVRSFDLDFSSRELDQLAVLLRGLQSVRELRQAVVDAGLDYDSAESSLVPSMTVPIDEEAARKVFKLIDVLEDCDDVQNIYANFDVSDEVMAEVG